MYKPIDNILKLYMSVKYNGCSKRDQKFQEFCKLKMKVQQDRITILFNLALD